MDSCSDWHRDGMDAATGHEVQSLARLHKGAQGVVMAITSGGVGAQALGDGAGSTIARRLLELGFVPGERIEVVEEIRPGRDPLAVRIGTSIFALRRREAQAVMVRLESAEPLEAAVETPIEVPGAL